MSDQSSGMPVDEVYYRDGVGNSVAMGLLKRARIAMFDLFTRLMQPSSQTRILDIGTSDVINDGANFLQRLYPWQRNIMCTGMGTGEQIRMAYPEIGFTQIVPGEPLPFPDQSFDIVCSNAVLEHVGGADGRRAMMAEHLRVGRAVFITVPNRWFPVEHHTSLPLLHYSPTAFRHLLSGTRYDYWTSIGNLDFIDRATLRREWPGMQPPEIHLTGLRLGYFSSNLALVHRPRPA